MRQTLTNTSDNTSTKRVNIRGAISLLNESMILFNLAEVSVLLGTSIVTSRQKHSATRVIVTVIMVAIIRISLLAIRGVPNKITTIGKGAHIGSTNMSNKRGFEVALTSTRVESKVLHSGVSMQHVHVNSSTKAVSRYHKMALHIRGKKAKQREEQNQERNRKEGLIFVIPRRTARG